MTFYFTKIIGRSLTCLIIKFQLAIVQYVFVYHLCSTPAIQRSGLRVLQMAGLRWKPRNNKDVFESSGWLV